MENLTFKTFFFRLYDRKIAEGSITFSQIGMSKNDFTKLYEDRLHLYVEEMMARFFGGAVGVV